MVRGPKKTVSVVMPLELYERLTEQAERNRRSNPSYIRQVLERYLWHMENEPEVLVGKWKIP